MVIYGCSLPRVGSGCEQKKPISEPAVIADARGNLQMYRYETGLFVLGGFRNRINPGNFNAVANVLGCFRLELPDDSSQNISFRRAVLGYTIQIGDTAMDATALPADVDDAIKDRNVAGHQFAAGQRFQRACRLICGHRLLYSLVFCGGVLSGRAVWAFRPTLSRALSRALSSYSAQLSRHR